MRIWQLNDTLSATSAGGRTWRTLAAALPFKGTDVTLQYLGRSIAIAFARYQTSASRTDDGGKTWRSVARAALPSGRTRRKFESESPSYLGTGTAKSGFRVRPAGA